MLVGLIGFLMSPGYTRTVTTDINILTEGDLRKRYLVVSFFKLIRQPFNIIVFLLIGYLM